MTHEIKLQVGSPHVLRDHIAEAIVGYGQGSNIRHTLEDLLAQVEEQVKPAIEEPVEFGSLIRAEAPHHYRALWTPSPTSGDHYWMSEKGYVEVWSELTDVEVLRVGLGDPEMANAEAGGYAKGFQVGRASGFAEAKHAFHGKVLNLLADAITSERKNAYEKAIQAVEELAP